ncbi:MAG TPA: peptidylprolyl isomerase [Planctomycetes bacterium]|nr:peptidylprolyl isomerase [Planctomycetota bacterium]
MKIHQDAYVEIRYRLYDKDGELVESSEDDGPVRYRHGAEEILPGLEKALEGAEAGATLRVTVPPEEAYGAYNPDGLVAVPRTELPSEHEYTPGDWISVCVEDDGDDHDHDHDHEMEMRIVEARETEIVLDANHPLAGQEVTFEVEVLSVSASEPRRTD